MIPSSRSPRGIAWILVRTLGGVTLDASELSFNSEYWPTYKCGKLSEWSPPGCDLFRAKDLGLDTSFVFELSRREAIRSRREARYLVENEAKAGIELQMMATFVSIFLRFYESSNLVKYSIGVETHTQIKNIAPYHASLRKNALIRYTKPRTLAATALLDVRNEVTYFFIRAEREFLTRSP